MVEGDIPKAALFDSLAVLSQSLISLVDTGEEKCGQAFCSYFNFAMPGPIDWPGSQRIREVHWVPL